MYNKKLNIKFFYDWNISSIFLKNLWIKEVIIIWIVRYFNLNDDGYMIFKILWNELNI